jgi:hypothetical protein
LVFCGNAKPQHPHAFPAILAPNTSPNGVLRQFHADLLPAFRVAYGPSGEKCQERIDCGTHPSCNFALGRKIPKSILVQTTKVIE